MCESGQDFSFGGAAPTQRPPDWDRAGSLRCRTHSPPPPHGWHLLSHERFSLAVAGQEGVLWSPGETWIRCAREAAPQWQAGSLFAGRMGWALGGTSGCPSWPESQ